MELSVQNVYGLLIRSRLLSLDDAKKMYERWQAEAKDAATNAGRFARWMVENQYVTEYQASLLARGHADCFFLNQYKVLDRLGKGRMAGVYKAVHNLGQVVAIKILPPSRAREPQLLARFQREARLALKLRHPHVVRTFQADEAGGLHYLVMEHLEGETLDEVLQRRGRLPVTEAVRVVHQSLLGLQHIHEQGLVHRDLKPANLMLVGMRGAREGAGGTVKILDIGLGRALFDESGDGTGSASLTGEGTLLGTPDYMAPEQARDARAADIRSDIYSLGCVLYHALAARPPFPDTNIISQMIRHATEAPQPLRELNPAVPDGLAQVVAVMMAKDPAQRFPTPGKAAQALAPFLGGAADAGPKPDADPRMRSYLTWLETEADGKRAAPVAAPAKAQAVAVPVKKEHAGKRRSKKHRRHRGAAVPVAAPVPAVNVELVPAGELRQEAPPAPRGLTRRDVVAFGLGVMSVLAAIFVGWLAARLFPSP